MKSWSKYTDEDRVLFAEAEYGNYKVGKGYLVGKKHQYVAGYVRDKIGYTANGEPTATAAGEQAYVVTPSKPNVPKDQVKNVAVVYRGSNTSLHNPGDTASDWIANDIPLAITSLINNTIGGDQGKAAANIPAVTLQQISAVHTINHVEKEYPHAQIDVYGHSLASMDGQFAVAAMHDPSRLHGAWLYEGLNVYNNLTPQERKQADQLKDKVFNYIDPKDIVPLGYPGDGAVGTLFHVLNAGYHGIGGEHMFGGYQFDSAGHLKTENANDTMALALKDIKQTYQQLTSQPLSGADQIMVDAGTARNILRALANTVDTELSAVKQTYQQAIKECDELWQKSLAMARELGQNLSEADIIDALAAGGCTHEKFQATADHYRNQISKLNGIEAQIKTWINQLNQAISQLQGVDAQIAGYFN